MGEPKKFLVTGASGFIGSHFCAKASADGHDVRAILQRRPNRKIYPHGKIIFGSLPYDIPMRAFEGIDTLVHCAVASTATTKEEADSINIEGTHYLIERAKECGVKKIIFLSSQSVVSENESDYARTKRENEALIQSSGLDYSILRPGLVYGSPPAGLFGRMVDTVKKLPAIPLLGGGKAIVQAIHVEDLVQAMLLSSTTTDYINEVHNLGDPDGISLKQFLKAIGKGLNKKKNLTLDVPLKPIEIVVSITEKTGIPLPITSNNIEGLKKVSQMDTRDSQERFSIRSHSIEERIADAVDSSSRIEVRTPKKIILVGAGKVALAHAMSISNTEGTYLAAVVDPNPAATKLYQSIGFDIPRYKDINTAIEQHHPDGAIICTPTYTHLPIAKDCLEKGISVLVEKPMAKAPSEIEEFLSLQSTYPKLTCLVGYQAAQYPHLEEVSKSIANGTYGKILGGFGFSLQSHIMSSSIQRWETDPSKAGGGVLINFGVHLVSMLRTALGAPKEINGNLFSIYSQDVEDVADLEFIYPSFSFPILTSWSIPGYNQPKMELHIQTESGQITLYNGGYILSKDDKVIEKKSQRDYDLGYNVAPDMSGAGIAVQHQRFIQSINGHSSEKIDFTRASEIETLVYGVYKKSGELQSIAPHEVSRKVEQWLNSST